MKTTHKTVAALAATLLLVVLGVSISFWTFRQIEQAAEVRKHTRIVINSADDLLSALRDAETGQRGYALTGNEAYLEPYLAVRDSIKADLEKMRQITGISAAHKHLDSLTPLVDAKLKEMAYVIELRRNHDMTGVLAKVNDGEGKRLMDSIRAEITSFDRIEEDLLAQREKEFQSQLRQLFILIASASLLVVLLALAFAWSLWRGTQQRIQSQVHLETKHLLELQQETNKQLALANGTLQVSEEKLEVTLNSIGDAVMATDAEGRVTLLNPLAEKLTGWTMAQACGLPVGEIFNIINKETRHSATIPVVETLAQG
ncbi:MAG: CHASE3 domain-containing protein, partial [Gallionellaceae bacterium]|nr:CHASE3 domain-containing protein [Gallionellaceae bacterium]